MQQKKTQTKALPSISPFKSIRARRRRTRSRFWSGICWTRSINCTVTPTSTPIGWSRNSWWNIRIATLVFLRWNIRIATMVLFFFVFELYLIFLTYLRRHFPKVSPALSRTTPKSATSRSRESTPGLPTLILPATTATSTPRGGIPRAVSWTKRFKSARRRRHGERRIPGYCWFWYLILKCFFFFQGDFLRIFFFQKVWQKCHFPIWIN